MKKWPKIFSVLLLVSLLTYLPSATFKISMSSSMETGIRQGLLATGVATEETIENEMEKAGKYYKEHLSQSKKIHVYARSTIWWILLVSGAALFLSKQWAYFLIYLATIFNLYTALPYLPFTTALQRWFITSFPISQIFNLLMVGFLVVAHRKLKRIPNHRLHSIAGSACSE